MAKTANEELLDALVRHQIYILRYSGYVRNRMTTILNASEDELARRIRDKLRTMQGLTKPVEWQRLEALQGTLAAIRKESWDEATKFLTEEMVQLSYQEPIQLDAIFKTVLPVAVETVMPSARFLRQIALSRPFEGRILKEWADTMAADDIRRIHSSIQAGMVAGEDMATIEQGIHACLRSCLKPALGLRRIRFLARSRQSKSHLHAGRSGGAWLDISHYGGYSLPPGYHEIDC